MWNPLSRGRSRERDCRCDPSFDGVTLVVDANDCPGRGELAERPSCRATVIDALAERDADCVVTRATGVERTYDGDGAAFLVATGRFIERVAAHDATLAERARTDPLRAGMDAVGRAGPVAHVAAETGVAEGVHRFEEYSTLLRPFVGPTIARSRVSLRPPANAQLADRYSLSTGATVRHYETERDAEFDSGDFDDIGDTNDTHDPHRIYHLEPAVYDLRHETFETLDAAARLLANGGVSGGKRAPGRAVRAVVGANTETRTETDTKANVDTLTDILRKYTQGYGVLSDLFADPDVSDVFATAPVADNPLRVRVDGEEMETNVHLTLSAATHRHVSAVPRGETVYPLSARNTNLFTVPSSDISDGVLSFLPDGREPKRVSLRAAGFALRAANETLATGTNESLRRHRNELQKSISASIDDIEANLRDELAASNAIDRTERRLAVHRGLADWRTTADRAIAISNGSAAEPIAREIERQQRVHWNRMRRDTMTIRVRFALESARRDVDGARQSNVKPVVSTTRRVLVAELKGAVQQGIENRVQRRLNESIDETVGDLPAGLPVVPIPGYWYATVNVWQVDVSGTYARFTVRAREGSPTSPGVSVTYSRESGTIRLDVDGDGAMETLGRTTPISFDTGTTVVVAVPPGKTGVGDVDGNADERSPGWANRSDNPFGAPGRRDDHALRRDRRPRRDDADGTPRTVRGGTLTDRRIGGYRRSSRGEPTRP